MGVDIETAGLRHRLHPREPLRLFNELARLYGDGFNVRMDYCDDYCHSYGVIERIGNPVDGCENVLTIPYCKFIASSLNAGRRIDWQADELLSELELVFNMSGNRYSFDLRDMSVHIYKENVNVVFYDDSLISRYSHLYLPFMDGYNDELDEELDEILDFRRACRRVYSRLGCETVIYFPDTILDGEDIFLHLDYTADELMRYIYEKRFVNESGVMDLSVDERRNLNVIMNVSDFFLGRQRSAGSDMFLNVLVDDFKDLD